MLNRSVLNNRKMTWRGKSFTINNLNNINESGVKYYIENNREFMGEDGHNILLTKLKNIIGPIITDKQIVGIDVGCCIGDYIPNIQSICSEEKTDILCFEPNPLNISVLEPKIKNENNIHLFKCALSNKTDKAGFYNYIGRTNIINNPTAGLRSGGSLICDTDIRKLQDVLDEHYDNKDIIIKFIKIDTEGSDGEIIKGFEKYMNKTEYIIFECSDCLDDHRGPGIQNPMKDIVDFLSKNNFDVYRIGTKKLLKVNDEYWNQVYDDMKFHSNCFALKKDNKLISNLIDNMFNYK